jgi:hypothetical protein
MPVTNCIPFKTYSIATSNVLSALFCKSGGT